MHRRNAGLWKSCIRKLEKDGLVVLAVNFQEGSARVREFLTKHNFTFRALLDRDGKVAERYQAWAFR